MKKFLTGLAVWLIVATILIIAASLLSPANAAENRALFIAHAAEIGQAYNLPPKLLQAVCEQESRWRNVAGRAGEIGVCQVKPTTVEMIYPGYAAKTHKKFFSVGDKGTDVARIQAVLAREKGYIAPIDGVYGPITDKAVRLYQQAHDLRVDGLVGPRTWHSLFGSYDPFPGKGIAQSLWNPQENIEWAARYLAWLQENVSSTPAIMLAAYNGGPGHPVVRYMLEVEKRRDRLISKQPPTEI